jgi:hypothetical protein
LQTRRRSRHFSRGSSAQTRSRCWLSSRPSSRRPSGTTRGSEYCTRWPLKLPTRTVPRRARRYPCKSVPPFSILSLHFFLFVLFLFPSLLTVA